MEWIIENKRYWHSENSFDPRWLSSQKAETSRLSPISNINDLGLRPQIYNSPSLTPWEDEMLPHNLTEKPPDNE